jgi:Tfp pilus assembly protein PilO
MRANADRMWLIGGAIGAAVLLAIGWFFFISPRKAQTSSLHGQFDDAQARLTTLNKQLADLRQQNRRLPQYLAQLAKDRRALPATASLSAFLRELEAAGDATGVSVSGVVVGAPLQVSGTAKPIYGVQITLTAKGPQAKLNQFLNQLQQVQPRAVLISTANASTEGGQTLAGGGVTLAVGLQVFVAPPKAAEQAAATTTTATTTG